ncbi:hypothetical protein GCM10010435_80280 [Winogradskya consettensis]|uniref:Uncharacterized protein n=1 Tax=Winogradskya consettensis TaxID=113560 RepID=A0A919SSU8_9ACTN|nr:hypothetical protein [Actinoplanes consettensis]GIM77309.1 hypothetical protein Aco04nite_54700 [Actinoplanes consettensis]
MDAHDESWWTQFPEASDRFDRAYVLEGLSDLISPKIQAPLLRREVKIATDTVVRYLERPSSETRAEHAQDATARLTRTLDRIEERSTGAAISTDEAAILLTAARGNYAAAAAAATRLVGATRLQRLFVTALRLERFDIPMVLRLLDGGQTPAQAIQAGHLLGRYSWWPSWLLRVVTERALAGSLDEETIAALDRCAYAELSPTQANLARKLLSGNEGLIDTAAERLAGLGEPEAAGRLREGDLNAVALAARLIPL